MQVLKQLKVALLVVDLAQPLHHQPPVLKVDSLNVFYVHCNYYVTPVYNTKNMFKGIQRLSGVWLAEANAARCQGG